MKQKSLIAALLLLLFATSLWASDTSVDGIWYDFDQNSMTATVTYRGNYGYSYSNEYSGSVVIPDFVTYNGETYNVTSIGHEAFYNCSSTSVTIPNSVTEIGYKAFSGCSGLTSISIPNSITEIGNEAFSGCSGLTSISVMEGNTTYDSRESCNAIIKTASNTLIAGCQNSIIPNSITRIGDGAFYGCNGLSSINIPNNVTSIGERAFSGCSNLASVTIPGSVTSIGAWAFSFCNKLTSVTIPNSVTSIGREAFKDCCGLASMTIPNSVTYIGTEAFLNVPNIVYLGTATGSPWGARCINGFAEGWLVYSDESKTQLCACSTAAMGDINIPNTVTSIGNKVFLDCCSLTSVTIPNSVTSIGWGTFKGCSGLTSVEWNAKNCEDFTSYSTPFYSYCSSCSDNFDIRKQITTFTFGEAVEHIPANLCYGMSNLTSVTLPDSVISIGSIAFYGCDKITALTIPNNVTNIGDGAFYGCNKIPALTIPDNVETIGASAFYNWTMLQYLTLGTSVNSIGNNAFANCPYLIEIRAKMALPPVINANVFDGCGDLSGITLNVPQRALALYRKANVWKEFDLQGVNDNVSSYTITFRDKDAGILESEFISITVPDAPVIDGFTFVKWQIVAGDLENGIDIQAVYTSNTPTSTPSVFVNPTNPTQKLIREGNVYILNDGKTYTLEGQEVK